jgi:hypothetical protein
MNGRIEKNSKKKKKSNLKNVVLENLQMKLLFYRTLPTEKQFGF